MTIAASQHKVSSEPSQHATLMQNFVDAILDGKPLIAPAAEGIHSVELANAILLSSARNESIELPLDAAGYEKFLQQKFSASRFQRNAPRQHGTMADDLARSFNR